MAGDAPAFDPMLPHSFRIQRVRRETSDTFTLDLQPADGGEELAFAPGQFNMLYVFGAGEVPISMSGDPGRVPLLQHTTRAVGPVTRGMRRLKRGDMIGVRGPFGHPWPLEEAAGGDLLIVAGGIGLAPLRPALYRAIAERERFRKVVLLYGARSPEDILYRSELQRWRSKLDLEIHVTVDRATSGWHGNVGVVTRFIGRTPFDPSNTVAMVCGPEVMMRFTAMELQKRGLAMNRIYVSMERNMKCAVGFCGRCQYGPSFLCKDGPVFRLDRIQPIFGKPEI
jgi:NAD(P)H-flavin reductase